jgi:hypothetical protein
MDFVSKRNTSDNLGKKLKILEPKSALEMGAKSAADIIPKDSTMHKPAAFLQQRLIMQRNN